MKTGTDTYIQWKQEHYHQDVIKSYSSYICHNPARKTTRLTASSFPTESPYPLAIFPSHFLMIFGKVTPLPLKKRGRSSNYGLMRRNVILSVYNIEPHILIKYKQLCRKNVELKVSFVCTIYLTSKRFCICVGTCMWNHTPLLKGPEMTAK